MQAEEVVAAISRHERRPTVRRSRIPNDHDAAVPVRRPPARKRSHLALQNDVLDDLREPSPRSHSRKLAQLNDVLLERMAASDLLPSEPSPKTQTVDDILRPGSRLCGKKPANPALADCGAGFVAVQPSTRGNA